MKKIAYILLVLAVCLICFSGKTIAAQDSSIHLYKLQNGQTVVIDEIHNNPIVTVDTWVRTGSVNENDKINGISHFLEHLFFKGTEKHPNGETARILENMGAKFNAATSKDFTHFYVTIASKDTDTAVDLLSDMLLNPAIPQVEFDKEKKVVLEEIRRSNDDIGDKIFKNLTDMVFRGSTYSYETLGTIKSVENISRDEAFRYYHKYYTPKNMITIVVGDVNPEKTLELIKKDFAQKPLRNDVKSTENDTKTLEKNLQNIKIDTGNYNTCYMLLGFKGTNLKNLRENQALDLAAEILGGDETSRLYKALKEKDNLVTSVYSYHYSMKDISIFVVDTNFDPKNYETVKKIINDEIANMVKNGVTQEELDRAKKVYKRAFAFSRESVEDISSGIGYSETLYGNLDYYTKYVDSKGGTYYVEILGEILPM